MNVRFRNVECCHASLTIKIGLKVNEFIYALCRSKLPLVFTNGFVERLRIEDVRDCPVEG
jgi:hypothetical protein